MKTSVCPDCGVAVRPDRMRRHGAAVHGRGGISSPNILRIVAAVMLICVIAAYFYLNRPQSEDGGDTVAPPDPNAVSVRFNTEDGFELHGTYYRGCATSPLVILVHGLNEDRHGYTSLVPVLRQKGWNVLAYDSRGHGQSTRQNGQTRSFKSFSAGDFLALPRDIAAAKHYALATFETGNQVAVVGASIGANEALNFTASGDGTGTRALVLLSPGTEYQGIVSIPPAQEISIRGGVDLFLFASEGDAAAAACARNLNATFAGKRELEIVAGSAHGTGLLAVTGVREALMVFLADALFG